MSFPSPPWNMRGQMWLSLFRVPDGGPGGRPPGMYGVALVDYQQGSTMTYGELLVARTVKVAAPARQAGKHVTVTDIWVDSPASRDGGRALWAVPKELAAFDWARLGTGVMPTVETVVDGEDGHIATGSFTRPRLLPPAAPFKGSTWQPREDGTATVGRLSGSARSFPVRGTWAFAQDGPLGWLSGLKPLVSVAMHDFRMTFR